VHRVRKQVNKPACASAQLESGPAHMLDSLLAHIIYLC